MSPANQALAMPYPGLRPFEAEDQSLFFGREAQVSAMLRQLEDHHFVAVVGSSGSGKSSLVRAGLLPAVREGFLLGTTDWLTIIIKPGHQPYQRLLRALSRITCCTEGTRDVAADDDPLAVDEMTTLAILRRTDRGLLSALDQVAISPKTKVMIVVDQFEELFAFRRAVNRDSVASRDEAAAFVGMLIRSASQPTSRVWAILTMRSDFIGDCEAFLGLPEEISHSQFLVPRLDRGQMEEAIARPAAVEEGTFKTFTFEEGLVNRIINDAGDRPDQLPLMQHAPMRTWKHAVTRANADGPATVTSKDYEAAGGIEMALSLHADAAWDEIKDDPKKAHIARRLFLLLCDISPDGQITRRRPQVTEIQAVTGASMAEIEQVVRVFQQDDRNFLLPPPSRPLTAESYLDISHEALLRQWRLFAGEWQERERSDASELRRLAEQASNRKQGQGGLLPAQDLERIDRWKQRVSAEWALRYVTKEAWEDAISFVEESRAQVKREEEQRRKQARYKRALILVIALILLVAAGVSLWLMRNANKAKAAQEALTRSFARTIGVSDEPAPEERAALWELAELDLANTPVREKVIDHWFQTEESIDRAFKRQAQGLRAAVGLNLAVRNHSASKATETADGLAKAALENSIDPYAYGYRMSSLGGTLAALAARMEPKDVASVAGRVAKALENSKDIDYRLLSVAPALAALAARMEPKEAAASVAARGAQVLTKALENSQETDGTSLSRLGQALAALAARMEPKDLASMADSVATALENSQKTDSYRLPSLGDTLAALAARMEPKDVASVADRVATALENSRDTDASYRLSSLGQVSSLGDTLAALAARMEPKDAAKVADRVAKALENWKDISDYFMSSVGQALAALAARIEPKEAASVAGRVAKALENSEKTDRVRLSSLGEALAALAARMEPKEAAASVAARGAQVLTKALENSQETYGHRLSSLGQALAALAARMEPKEAASVAACGAQVLAKALENPHETDARNLSSIGWSLGGLARLIPRARQTQLASLSYVLLEEMSGAPKRGEGELYEEQLEELSTKYEKQCEKRMLLAQLYALLGTQDLTELLKWPFCVGEAEKIALAELENKTGRKFGGDIWKFVEQAPSLGIKNLDAPAKRPKLQDALKELKSLATGSEVPRSSGGK